LGLTRHFAKNIYIIDDNLDFVWLNIISEKNNIFVKIDKEDVDKLKLHTWNISGNKYISSRIFGKYIPMHNYILNLSDKKIWIDHINRDKFDNRKSNYRLCTPGQNNRNKTFTRSLSKYRGVRCCDSKKGIYVAEIQVDGIRIFLKKSKDVEFLKEIVKYAKAYACEYYPEFKEINQNDIPQWIKEKIDKRLNICK
jgi:hypothetical protein